MTLIDILRQRSAYHNYDQHEKISEAVIREIIKLTTLTPTAYHLQNWDFIAVTSNEAKEQLYHAAYRQEKILDAPVTFIISGDTNGHLNLAQALQPSVDAKQVPPELAQSWINAAQNAHETNPNLRYAEALRSASLASMTLMLVAESMGYATAPMSGFDSGKVQSTFSLSEHIVPTLLISIGTPTQPRYAQKQRLPVDKILTII